MDSETLYFLLIFVIIGILSYFALRYITLQLFNNEIRPSSDVDDVNYKQRSRITDVTTDRSSEGVATSIMSVSDDTVSDVPSRERVQEERLEAERIKCIENASDQYTATDDDTEDEGDESDDDEEEENSMFQTFVDEANLIQCTNEFGVLPGLMKYISKNIQTWKTRKLKIAIIGNSGTGKSSLINAIRGLKPEDKGAAPVGVTETTMKKQEYVLPSNENISLWDLPGVGTHNFKKKDYLHAVNLKEFDAFMIVSATRFSENDVWLANEILKLESYIFFLRTKIDADLNNEKIDYPRKYNEASCLRKIKMDIVSNFKKSKFPQKRSGIYLVSSRESSKFDFPKLLFRLTGILSKKRFALRRVLENHLKSILKKNKEQRKGHFFWTKVSLLFGLGSLPSFTREMHNDCKIAFSLDDKTIESVSDEIGMSVNDLKTKELKYFKLLEEHLKKEEQYSYFLGLIVIQGCPIFIKQLNEVCDVMAMDEGILVHLVLDNLEEKLRTF
ncbi:T-cell-specific guanine nucleotide triphosphate-binding protein 2-like [Ruditapes philippinarum]|uniref:T-cell-specific guanine nucleotide triphosphate-binding protein 2-like n=1 Tax=Ruditapes philippinarum TaxID=129788 RepID=UPI00295B7954|nr:T-cell-specific guanine nucleotide triphosphate-binding protein 2-like [Ruditapes philippinarum]